MVSTTVMVCKSSLSVSGRGGLCDRILTLSITLVDRIVEKYVVGSMSVLTDREVTVAVMKSVMVAVETRVIVSTIVRVCVSSTVIVCSGRS